MVLCRFCPSRGREEANQCTRAGMRKRIDRLRQLIEGFQREMQAVQSDHAILNWMEYPAYLGALLKAQQGYQDAKEALQDATDRIAGRPRHEPR
jgi:hypothetical protein